MSDYEFWLYDPARTQLLEIIRDVRDFNYVLNDAASGALSFTVPPIFPREYFQRDAQIEIWRTDDDGIKTLEGGSQWFLQTLQDTYAAERLYTIGCTDGMGLLERRRNLNYAGTRQSTKNMAADDMMKELVRENFPTTLFTPIAGFARSLAGQPDSTMFTPDFYNNPLFSVQTPTARAPVIRASFAWTQLSSALTDIAAASFAAGEYLTYRMVQIDNVTGAIQFRTYIDSSGPDCTCLLPDGSADTGGIVFTPENGSIAQAVIVEDYTNARTAVMAGGGGEEQARQLGSATILKPGPWSYNEDFAEKTDTLNVDLLNNYAAGQLQLQQPKRRINGNIIETDDIRYGRDFGLGYKLTAQIGQFVVNCRVNKIGISFAQDTGEVISASIFNETTIA